MDHLFGIAFSIAVGGLDAVDVHRLTATARGDVAGLGWVQTEHYNALDEHLRTLASRERPHRYRLRAQEGRDRLLELAGDVSDPRHAFLLAFALDTAFGASAWPEGGSLHPTVAKVPRGFLVDHDNRPPSLGQMTATAACRRWMQHFWFVGNYRALDAFGAVPQVEAAKLSEIAQLGFEEATATGELRVAAVAWRRHTESDLVLAPFAERAVPLQKRPSFAIIGLRNPSPPLLSYKLLDHLATTKTHVAVMPELALTTQELEEICATLRLKKRRFPCLIVTGLVHRREGTSHVNESVALDSRGTIVLRQRKIEPFASDAYGIEDILPGAIAAYAYVDTPVGRLVVNICRDVRSDVPALLNRVLGATLLLVPCYSNKLDFVLEEARVLGARQLAAAVAVNPLREGLRDVSAAYAPIVGKSGQDHVAQGEVPGDAAAAVRLYRFRLRGNAAEFSPAPIVAL